MDLKFLVVLLPSIGCSPQALVALYASTVSLTLMVKKKKKQLMWSQTSAHTTPTHCAAARLGSVYIIIWLLIGTLFHCREELLWFYQEGASFLFPDKWEDFLEPIPKVERGDLMSAYYRR